MSATFPETEWSQLVALGEEQTDDRRKQILDRLVNVYWPPVYHYVRALRPRSRDEAEDITQQFFTTLLDRGSFDSLLPDRGSFRGFLKTALRNFIISQERAAAVRPRLFPFDQAELVWAESPDPDPEQAFDREWVRLLLAKAVAELEQELTAAGKFTQYQVFASYCLGQDDVTYESLAAVHGISLDDVRNGLRRSRQRLREILRGWLRNYLGPDDDVEAELRFITSDQL